MEYPSKKYKKIFIIFPILLLIASSSLMIFEGCVYRSDLFDKHFTRDNEDPVPEPDINLKQSGNDVPIGGLGHDFGYIQIGTSSSPATFTIENTGTADLTINDIYSNSSEFTLSVPAVPFIVSVGSNKTFTVTFEPSGATGSKSGTIAIDNDDPDEVLFSFEVQGYTDSIPIPDIHLKQGSTNINNGTGNYYFGHANISGPYSQVTFTIENNGAAVLNIASINSSDPVQFSVDVSSTNYTIGTSGSTTFDIKFSPSSTGHLTATISINSDDLDENPYTFTVEGDGDASPTPEIIVKQHVTELVDGSGVYDFGNINVASSLTKDFVIHNHGSAVLTISSVYLSSGDTVNFSIDLSSLSSVVNPPTPFDNTTFSITFCPGGIGTKSAVVTIQSNDPDENPYTFTVKGYGDSAPVADLNLMDGMTYYPDGSTYDFGQVSGNSTRTFTIKNLGTTDLNITNILLTDGDPDFTVDLSSTVFTIPPSGTTTFDVTFTPQGSGRYRNLEINSNDPNESPYNLRLEGDLD